MRSLLIVGLGNPGNQYSCTRHNAGFMAVDRIADVMKFPDFSEKKQSYITKQKVNNVDVILLKPQTFMNLSGSAVWPVVSFFKISHDDIFVIHDDIDLKLGNIRMKFAGSSGGHNGIKSIDGCISPNYWRIRVGVGRPDTHHNVVDHVLGNFNEDEFSKFNNTLDKISSNIQEAIFGDKSRFVQLVNSGNDFHTLK